MATRCLVLLIAFVSPAGPSNSPARFKGSFRMRRAPSSPAAELVVINTTPTRSAM